MRKKAAPTKKQRDPEERRRWNPRVLGPFPAEEAAERGRFFVDLFSLNMLDEEQLVAFAEKYSAPDPKWFDRIYEAKLVADLIFGLVTTEIYAFRPPARKAVEAAYAPDVLDQRAGVVATVAGYVQKLDAAGRPPTHECDVFAYELVYDHVNSAMGWPEDSYPSWSNKGQYHFMNFVAALCAYNRFFGGLLMDREVVENVLARCARGDVCKSGEVSRFYCAAMLSARVGAFGAKPPSADPSAPDPEPTDSDVNNFRNAWKGAGGPVDHERVELESDCPEARSKVYLSALSMIAKSGPLRRKGEHGPHPSDEWKHEWTEEELDRVSEIVGWRSRKSAEDGRTPGAR